MIQSIIFVHVFKFLNICEMMTYRSNEPTRFTPPVRWLRELSPLLPQTYLSDPKQHHARTVGLKRNRTGASFQLRLMQQCGARLDQTWQKQVLEMLVHPAKIEQEEPTNGDLMILKSEISITCGVLNSKQHHHHYDHDNDRNNNNNNNNNNNTNNSSNNNSNGNRSTLLPVVSSLFWSINFIDFLTFRFIFFTCHFFFQVFTFLIFPCLTWPVLFFSHPWILYCAVPSFKHSIASIWFWNIKCIWIPPSHPVESPRLNDTKCP